MWRASSVGMAEAPPDSIGIVDTMGCATPEAIKYMVRWVKRMTGLPIEIHTHNDFGIYLLIGCFDFHSFHNFSWMNRVINAA